MYRPVLIKENDIFHCENIELGCRTYIAVLGGIQTEKILGSRSQYSSITSQERINKKMVPPY